MKKCEGCKKDIDKYAIACEYCGHLMEKEEGEKGKESDEAKGGQVKGG